MEMSGEERVLKCSLITKVLFAILGEKGGTPILI